MVLERFQRDMFVVRRADARITPRRLIVGGGGCIIGLNARTAPPRQSLCADLCCPGSHRPPQCVTRPQSGFEVPRPCILRQAGRRCDDARKQQSAIYLSGCRFLQAVLAWIPTHGSPHRRHPLPCHCQVKIRSRTLSLRRPRASPCFKETTFDSPVRPPGRAPRTRPKTG